MIPVKGTTKAKRGPEARYVKAIEAHARIEADLARTMRRWDKSRALVRRLEKALDREFNARAEAPHVADDFGDGQSDGFGS